MLPVLASGPPVLAPRLRRSSDLPRRPAHLPPLRRVGHKGAAALARGNTRESFEAGLRAGVDMIEFDVMPLRDGRLVLAHDPEDVAEGGLLTLDEGLDHLAGEEYANVALDVDLKLPGCEAAVAEALLSRGLEHRALVATTFRESLQRIGAIAPELERGWSIPRARRNYLRGVFAGPALAYMAQLRALLPRRVARELAAGRCEALMAHWLLVGPRLVEAVHHEGGRLFVWTVDDAERIRRLDALGVDGVITNDPRLFRALPEGRAGGRPAGA